MAICPLGFRLCCFCFTLCFYFMSLLFVLLRISDWCLGNDGDFECISLVPGHCLFIIFTKLIYMTYMTQQSVDSHTILNFNWTMVKYM